MSRWKIKNGTTNTRDVLCKTGKRSVWKKTRIFMARASQKKSGVEGVVKIAVVFLRRGLLLCVSHPPTHWKITFFFYVLLSGLKKLFPVQELPEALKSIDGTPIWIVKKY